MKKRILSIMLTFVMLLSVSPLGTFNLTASADTENGFEYSVENNEATITGYTGSSTNLVIPFTLGGYPVTELGDCAFLACETLINVDIPDSVTYIGESAFRSCPALESVTLPNSVTYIDYSAFEYCSALKNVTIPNSVTYIGESAFASTALTSITIPNSINEISSATFYNCTALTNVTIQSGVTYIGLSAFNSCISLASVTIPNSINEIGSWAFYNCNMLTNVYYYGSETQWDYVYINDSNEPLLYANIHFANAESCSHSFYWITIKSPTCATTGYKTQVCSFCYKTQNEDTVINATGKHNYTCIKTVNATYDVAGYKEYKCNNCTASYKTPIAKLTKTSLANAKVSGIKDKAYTGKAFKQSIKVKLGSKTLSSKTDYTVSYKNNKNIGTATVTLRGKGKYSGSIKKTFTIKPKTASLKSFKSPKKKQAKVTWKKDSKVTGYQIVYATNSKFTKGKKTVTVKSNKTTSKTIKSLKSKKTYYVKVRSYKTVNGKKIYGAYSKVKKVKIK